MFQKSKKNLSYIILVLTKLSYIIYEKANI